MNFITNILRLNWLATIAINHKIGGWMTVFRMPVKVYGKLKLDITGSIILPGNAIRNTLIIGSEHEDYTVSSERAQLRIDGTWIIEGLVRIGHDCFIGIENGATLKMGDGTFIGRDSQIHCSGTTVFGRNVLCGEIYVCDSDVHTITENGIETPMVGTVTIGDGVYLGFRTKLLKDTSIPPRSVVASGAICTKDYGTDAELLLAGIPAKIVKHNVTACTTE